METNKQRQEALENLNRQKAMNALYGQILYIERMGGDATQLRKRLEAMQNGNE